MASLSQSWNWLEDIRSKDDEMSGRMWKTIKTKVRKAGAAEAERRRKARRGRADRRRRKKKKPKKKRMIKVRKVAEEWKIWNKKKSSKIRERS